jgi:hypothetical protein
LIWHWHHWLSHIVHWLDGYIGQLHRSWGCITTSKYI